MIDDTAAPAALIYRAAPDFSLLLILADDQGVRDVFSRRSLGQVKSARRNEG